MKKRNIQHIFLLNTVSCGVLVLGGGGVVGKEIVLHSNLVWLSPKAKFEKISLVQIICMRSDPSNQGEKWKSQMGRKKVH